MKRRPTPIVLLALAIGSAGCGSDPLPPVSAAPPVVVERARAHDVLDQIEATGQLIAQAEAKVAAQVGGEVTGIAADEGSGVELAQLIVEIDPERRRLELDDARASLAQANAQSKEARRELKRVESLAERGVAPQSRLDEARTQVELARSQKLAAEARAGLSERALADASVRAPFAGLIARRFVNVGEFVTAGQPLFSLVALDPIEAEFFLPEVESSRIALGQTVEVRVASHPGEVFRGEVSVVSPIIEPDSRTRRAKAVIPNPDGRLLPGTFASVDLGVAERSDVIMIPKEALLLRSDGTVLFRLQRAGDRVERVRVEAGRHRGALVEVQGSLAQGDWVVVRGQANLVDGSPVSLRNEDGSEFEVSESETAGQGG